MVSIHPTRGNVFVKVIKEAKQGLIEIPKEAQVQPQSGEVLAMGLPAIIQGGVVIDPIADHLYDVGDVIYFRKWKGVEIDEGADTFKLIPFEEVMGVEPKEKKA